MKSIASKGARMRRRQWAILLMSVLGAASVARAEPTGEEFFEQRVRPLLAAKCLECHGDEEPEGGLQLTSRAGALKGGESGPAVVAGRPEESLLIQAVRQMGELKMPPDGKLRDDEIAALVRWIEGGAPWPAEVAGATRKEFRVTDEDRRHWAFQPIVDRSAPAVGDAAWPQTNIDRFVLAKLEQAGLHPAPAADRRSLLRRAYYDLVGLPPTWDEVQAFVNDPASTPEAFEKVVDRLLALPAYGERWGRHWLDVARFADTKDGVLMYGDDRIRPYAYTYRDYVIRAFNEDVPFDRFVEEQLAADLIEPKVEPWRLAALGFLTLGRMYDNNVHDVIDDRIDTVSRGFLGLTVSCARCHDHKYDPIPTADYYSLYGVFAGSEAPLELPLVAAPESVAGGAEFEAQAAPKREELRKFVDEQFELLSETARQRVGDYLVRVATTKPDPLETAIFFLSLAPEDLRPPITARWRRYLDGHAQHDDPVFGPWRELMQLAEPDSAADAAGAEAFSKGAAAVLAAWQAKPAGVEPGQVNPLVLEALAKAPLAGRADVAKAYGELLKRVYEESKSTAAAGGVASPPPADPVRQQLLKLLVGREAPAYFPKSQTRRYMSRGETDAFGGKVQELDRLAVKSPAAPPRAMVLYDAEAPVDPQIFVRGNPSQPGKRVPRQFLEVLSPGERTPFAGVSGRLDLARAIASPANPLTARVIVNRVWLFHFGEPLASSPSDFGKRSPPPVYADLLDHLAARFMAEGWSLKKLHRSIMLSSVYQQASATNAEMTAKAKAADPDNRLLWRMHRQRLDFEALRDTLLAVSGRLEERAGGRPADIVDSQSRCRTVYGLVDRQSLPSMFRAFDFAAPDQSVERRPRTMAPQQALFAMNSPFVIEQAKALAARLGGTGSASGTPTDAALRIAALYRATLAREPAAEELAAATAFVNAAKDAQSQLGVWEQLAQVLLCANELMYLD